MYIFKKKRKKNSIESVENEIILFFKKTLQTLITDSPLSPAWDELLSQSGNLPVCVWDCLGWDHV